VVAGRIMRGAQKADLSSTSTSSGESGLPQQRATEYNATSDASLPETPQAGSMAPFPPDQPGTI
jgi:hypothetical protein